MKVTVPFLFVNPKSYLWGEESLKLALACDRISRETGVMIFYTCPYADIRMIAEKTSSIVVTAQNMDALKPGRGMGAVLPESLAAAGAKAVVLNHAENQKTLSELYACINRAHELGMITIVCADSTTESKAVAALGTDVILSEPTALIGTGQTADVSYTVDCVREIKAIDPDVKVMIASGITTGVDCYKVVVNGADGSGSTSGIVNAPSREGRVEEMVEAIIKAMKDRPAVQAEETKVPEEKVEEPAAEAPVVEEVKAPVQKLPEARPVEAAPIPQKEIKGGVIYAPLCGEVVSLANVPSEEIASGAMGDGIAIMPSKGEVYAPCDGVIGAVYHTSHAIGINDVNGAEVLIHVGLETVKLDGKGFEVLVKEGDAVKTGQLLMKFDMAFLKAQMISCITPVLITNSGEMEQVDLVGGGIVAPGNSVMYYK